MNRLLIKFIDSLFPPSGEALCVRNLGLEDIENVFQVTRTSEGYACSSYADARVRALIQEAKFRRNRRAFELLSALLRKGLQDGNLKADIIIPIPLSSHRLRGRGYNQVYEMLTAPREPLPIPVVPDALIRMRDTRPQTELPRAERLSNLLGAFKILRPECIKDKHVLLVDDVMTTGATMEAARDALLKASPASVTCIALAH